MKNSQEIILECLNQYFSDELDMNFDKNDLETRLFGGGGPIDSMGLVVLLVEIEEAIEEKFDIEITIASEKAMSRRTSPFISVKYLIEFINELINDE